MWFNLCVHWLELLFYFRGKFGGNKLGLDYSFFGANAEHPNIRNIRDEQNLLKC